MKRKENFQRRPHPSPNGKLDEYGFSRFSKKLHEDAWFYEGRAGLTIAVTLHGTSQSIVGCVEIPWHRLKGSIRRYEAFKRKHSAPPPPGARPGFRAGGRG